jgi:hypothetical protein
MATWKKVITSGSQAELATLGIDSSLIVGADVFEFTGSVKLQGGITASNSGVSLLGTSSWAISASWSPGSTQSETSTNSVITDTTTGTGPYYLTFVDGTSGNRAIRVDSNGLTFNATTNTLTVANVTGTSSWATNATTATSATTATNANNVAVTDTTTGTGPYYLAFTDGTTGNRAVRVDSATLTFNATTNTLTVANVTGTSSWATNATTATTATQVANALTPGNGLSGTATTYNGSAAVTFNVGAGALITSNADDIQVATSSLVANRIPKFSNNTLSGSNIADTGAQVQILSSAGSGLSVAAGGVTVTGNSTFNNNLTVAGDLTVAGTASFQNTQNLLIGDRFAAFASGSTSVTDGGIIVVSSTGAGGMSGSAWFLESTTDASPNYGRFAVAYNVHASASSVQADEYAVTVKIAQGSNPSSAPTWGGANTGAGNMWITSVGDIFIYA